MDIKQLKRDARQLPVEQRSGVIAQLMIDVPNKEERDDAMGACVDLCADGVITKGLLAPHTETILARWAEFFLIVQPLQKDPSKLNWILDDDYKPLRRRGGILLDLMGYLPESAEAPLREGLSLRDPRLKMFAALSLLRNLKHVDLAELDAIGASHEIRLLFWKQLEKIDMQSIMPAKWATPSMLAAADLSRWASSPSELNVPPEEIECMGRIPVDLNGQVEEIYLFRFREFPKPWEDGEGWFAGVAGPFRDGKCIRSPWSRFERRDSMTPAEHIAKLLGIN
jgi:hypothetical protein